MDRFHLEDSARTISEQGHHHKLRAEPYPDALGFLEVFLESFSTVDIVVPLFTCADLDILSFDIILLGTCSTFVA